MTPANSIPGNVKGQKGENVLLPGPGGNALERTDCPAKAPWQGPLMALHSQHLLQALAQPVYRSPGSARTDPEAKGTATATFSPVAEHIF